MIGVRDTNTATARLGVFSMPSNSAAAEGARAERNNGQSSHSPLDVHYTRDLHFHSRRSPVVCTHGATSSSQPYASQIGLDILKGGGNAVDACVAMAAALGVTEPGSTGLGGDCFAIVYNAKTKAVSGLNASGRSPAALTLDTLPAEHHDGSAMHPLSVHCITVPGAAAGWVDAIEKWGTMKLADVLAPAIRLAEEGYAVAPITAHSWQSAERLLQRHEGGQQLLIDGRAPRAGEVFRNPNLARVMRLLGEKGKAGYYAGEVAESLIALLKEQGGFHEHADLAAHLTTFPTPISVRYHGVDVHEIPPSGQGLTALLALNILDALDPPLSSYPAQSVDYFHLLIEAMRLAFADTRWYVADPDHTHVPISALLSSSYGKQRAALLHPQQASRDFVYGSPVASSDTVSFCAVDASGNACSFINSNYMGFGAALVPSNCGFSLQNRGAGFSTQRDHPNVLQAGKRPYHTIIPGMATVGGELLCPFSVMGGFMQPQGHVQVMVGTVDYGLDPQSALDAPRFCIEDGTAGGHVCIEEGVSEEVVRGLRQRGHDVRVLKSWDRAVFGRGQIIRKDRAGVLWCGSDGRSDGAAAGY